MEENEELIREKDKKDKKDKVKTQYKEPKPCTVTELISPEQGGQLLLDWKTKGRNGVTGPKVKVEVKIFPGALDEDTLVAVQQNVGSVGVVKAVSQLVEHHDSLARLPRHLLDADLGIAAGLVE